MLESEGSQEILNQVLIQALTAARMLLWDADVALQLSPTECQRERQRQRHGWLALEKPSFNWNAQNMYVELLNFEMEVMKSLETKADDLTFEERTPVIRTWLGQEGLHL